MGRISRELLRAVRAFKTQKVLDILVLAAGRDRAAGLQETDPSSARLARMDPAHAVYVYVQNHVSALVEQLSELEPLFPPVDVIVNAEEAYLPSGPPMSPGGMSEWWVRWGWFECCRRRVPRAGTPS